MEEIQRKEALLKARLQPWIEEADKIPLSLKEM